VYSLKSTLLANLGAKTAKYGLVTFTDQPMSMTKQHFPASGLALTTLSSLIFAYLSHSPATTAAT